jgi:hypothetical protein
LNSIWFWVIAFMSAIAFCSAARVFEVTALLEFVPDIRFSPWIAMTNATRLELARWSLLHMRPHLKARSSGDQAQQLLSRYTKKMTNQPQMPEGTTNP